MSWALGVLTFVVTVAFVPGFPEPATTGRWAILSFCLPAMLLVTRAHVTPAHVAGAAFLALATASLAWTPVLVEGLNALWWLLLFAAAFMIGAEQRDLRPVYTGLGLGLVPSACFAIAQAMGYAPVEQFSSSPAGLFANSNLLGSVAAIALVGGALHRMWWLLPTPLLCLVLSGSRGAWLGALAASVLMLWARSRLAALALALAILVASQYAFLHSRGSTSVTSPSASLHHRSWVWLDTVEGLTWQGRGIGSFWVASPAHAPRQQAANMRHWHAHNDFLEILYELGALGLVLALAFTAFLAVGPLVPERIVLLAFLALGVTGFPLYQPVPALVGALAAGALAGRWRDLRNGVAVRELHPYARQAGRHRERSYGALRRLAARCFAVPLEPAAAAGSAARERELHPVPAARRSDPRHRGDPEK